MLIEQGITPNFYLHKVCANSQSIYPDQLSLNPFEFFFFNFSFYVKSLNRVLDTNNYQIEFLYLSLLDNYIIKLLPSNNKCVNDQNVTNQQNSLWQSLSSTTSNLLHLGQTNNKSTQQQQENSFIQKPSLLNIKPLQNFSFKQTEDYNQKSFDSLGSIIYKCETIINILTEMWLNINIPSNLNKKKVNSTLIKNNCPNVIYMMCVRVFIKRLHTFANSITDKSLEMGNMPAFENHELDEIKKSIWSSKYQIPKKFFSFLKLSFEHWPCDSSFRMPLETWLSFIQPWRYVDESLKNLNLNENQSALSNSSNGQQTNNLNRWKNFIQENILFYSAIYKEVIARFINLDLLSLNNVNMLFRVPKVYYQQHLTDLIKEAEANCENVVVSNSWLASASLRGSSLLSPNVRNNSQSIYNKDLSFTNLLEDNEKNGFVYVSFFSDEQKKMVIKLIGKIISSIKKLEKIQLTNQEKTTNKNQIFEFFYSLFDNSNQYALEEKKNIEEMNKIRHNLEICKDRLIQIYELNLNELEQFLRENDNFENLLNVSFQGDRVDSTVDHSTLNRDQFNQTTLNPFTTDKIEYNGNPGTSFCIIVIIPFF